MIITDNIVPSHNSGVTNLSVKSSFRLFGGINTRVWNMGNLNFKVVMDHMILSK